MLNISHINTNKFKFARQRKSSVTRFGTLSIGMITVLLVFMLGLFYMLQVNEISTMGYEIHSNEVALKQLEDQKERLEIEQAKLKSLQGLQDEIRKLNYNDVDSVSYTSPVHTDNDALAQR